MAALGKCGETKSVALSALLDFHRLPEAVTLAIHLEDCAVMGQPVEQRGGHPLSLENLVPLAEREIARDEHATTLVTVGENAKQKFDTAAAHRYVA